MARAVVKLAEGLSGKLARSAGMGLALEAVARLIAGRAQSHAPFPRIAEGIKVAKGLTKTGMVARVNSTDWISHFWEYGTAQHAPRPFMGPAAAGIGQYLKRRRIIGGRRTND